MVTMSFGLELLMKDMKFFQTIAYHPNQVGPYPSDKIEQWAGGFRSLNEYTPDGGTISRESTYNKWIPITLRKSGL